MNKGTGRHLQGVRWLMASGAWFPTYWATKGHYIFVEVMRWECASPVRPLYPLGVEL